MDFASKGIKELVSDFTTVFTRAKQYAEETIGTAEKTELDQEYESLSERAEIYKQWTERIVANLEAIVQPNPNMRYGDLFIEKTIGNNELKKDRLRNLEYLGNDMIDAGIALGPTTSYGNLLVKVGKTQKDLGQSEKEFVFNTYQAFIIPFRKFLEEDIKTINKEQRVLEIKRLDLDIAKNKLRKTRSIDPQSNPKLKPEIIAVEINECEREAQNCGEELQKQLEITKLLLDNINAAQANHERCLNDFITLQIEYYSQSYRHMLNLQRDLQHSTITSGIMVNNSKSNSSILISSKENEKNLLENITSQTEHEILKKNDEIIQVHKSLELNGKLTINE